MTLTPNYGFILPAVNSSVDEDLWGDELNENFSNLDTDLKAVSDVADNALASAQLPIGSLYFNAAVATNPGDPSMLGYGTWVAHAQGRVVVGVGSGTDSNGTVRAFTLGETNGQYTHTQTGGEVGSHSHTIPARNTGQFGSSNTVAATLDNTTMTTNASAAPTAMDWMQPYIGAYVWRRTA